MKKYWVKKTNSFKNAQEFDEQYYLKMGYKQRLDIMQFLREMYFKFNKSGNNAGRKRLRRSIKIIKQA